MQKGWRLYLGLGLLAANFVGYGLVAVVPFLCLGKSVAAALVGAIILFAELSFIASLVLLGRPFLKMLKARCMAWFARKPAAQPLPVSRKWHAAGICMLIASLLPYFNAEFMLILGYTEASHIRVIIAMLLASDVLFLAGLFVLGDEFWERLKKLFQWPGADPTPAR